jgi:D-alanyl-D-alanine carboxypeptidase
MTTTIFDRITLVVCAVGLAGAAACVGEDPKPAPNARVTAELQRVLDEAVEQQEQLLPGAIVYYREPGHESWSGTAGLGDMQAGTPIRPKDRIRAGSVLKTFLATVTLQHVEEGTLSLDQTLPELLPRSVTDRVKNADQITLRMLLGHTSGIPEWNTHEFEVRFIGDPNRIWTNDDVLGMVADEPALFPPGSSFTYSNTNYTLVGMVLDQLGEGSWRSQVRKRVFDRLAMRSSELPEPGDPGFPGDYAHGYLEVEGEVMDFSLGDPSMAGASGGNALVTTVQDLAQFLDALLDGELFKRPETLEAMTTMVERPHESGFPYAYGLGLETYEFEGTKVIGHAGSTAGYSVMMSRIEGTGSTLVTAVTAYDLFTNAVNVFIPSVQVIAANAEGM